MAPKSLVLVAAALLLVAAVGQVRGVLSPLPGVLPSVVPVSISGIVPCSIGSNINVTAVPPFANATAQVVCGSTVVATATTSNTGALTIILNSIFGLPNAVISSLLNPSGGQCKVVVATPLVACNVTLADVTGTLSAPLQLLNSATTTNILGIIVPLINGAVPFTTGLFSVVPIVG